ncbi:amidohydrolase [Mahella australiensis]|uniref:Amidohydrolase n=1 Tax=Mahella australiensis (strain DSM 15567 / CIP 107919 / 50-1 BON) TaxID=697281 RepID=F3ZXT5_MAHA5|nr:amidohydrolase [Mahella australiensis]AEE96605.1 amidohydrolase [Mahella australiensis 50-1 BON]
MKHSILIKNGKILTMAGQDYDGGDLLVEDDKIRAIGYNIDAAENVDIIDASGMYILPGLIDAHCHVGMWNDGMGFEGADGNEDTDPSTPHLRAIDGVNPFDRCFREAMEAGITTVVTGPGSANVIGGQFVALKTYGRRIEDMIIKEPLAVKAALGENPKRTYHDQEKSPYTRMAIAGILRQNLVKAQEYKYKLAESAQDPEKRPERDLEMEALLKVLNKEIPLKVHAHRADDILTAIRIAKEFDINITLDHCTEGYMIVDILAEEGYPVILGPLISERSKIELRNQNVAAPGILSKVGLEVAIMTDHPVIPVQYLSLSAAIAVREGMDEAEAMKAITINAAHITGIADRVGSLEVGKDADIAIFDGNPLEFRTKSQMVFINGRLVFQRQ